MGSETVSTGNAVDTGREVDEALARLCHAECMLELVIRAHDGMLSDTGQWRVNEALRGVTRLLDGVYATLAGHVAAASPASTEVGHG